MRINGRVLSFDSTDERTRVDVVFPEGVAIVRGDKCRTCETKAEGFVTHAFSRPADNTVRAEVEFPAGTRIGEGAKISLLPSANAEPASEEPGGDSHARG